MVMEKAGCFSCKNRKSQSKNIQISQTYSNHELQLFSSNCFYFAIKYFKLLKNLPYSAILNTHIPQTCKVIGEVLLGTSLGNVTKFMIYSEKS